MFGIQVPRRVFYLFTNASQAVYNKKSKLYEVDCDFSKSGNVTFNIGGAGNTTDQFSQQLILTPSDYIRYKSMLKVCFVSVHGSDWIPPPGQDRLQFGKFFLDRFCVAYNAQTDEIGFSNVKEEYDTSNGQTGIKSAGGVSLERNNNLFVTNITIGSPPQHFVAAIDYWLTSDLSVISREADLETTNRNLPTKHTFDSSASKTFHASSGTFEDDYVGKGILGNDIARFGRLNLRNLTFGIIDKLGSAYKHQPVDAIVGLSPDDSQNEIPSLLQQISVQLIKPVMSLWAYSIMGQDGQGQLTLGAEDETHCSPNWMYVPRCGVGHSVFVSSVSTSIQTTTMSVAVNTSMTVEPDAWMHVVPMPVLYLFTNASHAVYNSTIDFFVVDCDLRKAGNVILTLGSHEDSKQLILKPEDYISYMPYYKACFVAVYGYFEKYQPDSIIELGELFLNRRCMAYNIQNNEVGFADVKDKFKTNLKFWKKQSVL
uniref:Peptidase A1 domain-containing protein n=1 Tax=Ditylenchus dipsaci TaxID=166011 RepID=A0A915E4Z0_9BILA